MKLSQVVRERFNAITEWRSGRVPWSEVDERIRAMGIAVGTNSVRTLYRMELAWRRSPERAAAFSWANGNYQAIKGLLDQGYDWAAILLLVPLDHEVAISGADFSRLIAEFKTIERLRSPAVQASWMPTGEERVAPTPLPHIAGEVVGTKVAVAEPAQDSLVGSEQVSKEWLSARFPARVELVPRVDPYESGPELYERMMDAGRTRNEMHQRSLGIPEEEQEAAKKLAHEAYEEYDQLKVDFLYRFSDFRAKHSKLHLLSTKALECGAFEVADAGAENAIVLQGYDRPDATEGFEEVPEWLFIRERLRDDEVQKIEEAYSADGLELGKRSPVVRLAEAVHLRREYLFRPGWHEYDTLVRLEGDDFPSPALCNADKWNIRSRSIDLWPKLTGKEPVQPGEFERKQLTYRADPELTQRGEWT